MEFGYFTLSDNHYENNPRDANQFVSDITAEALYADQLGMHSAWIGEHHFNSLGVLSCPDLVLAYIAARTKHIRLAPAVTVTPLHHPIRVAEQWATLDLLSGGRVDFAAGRGYDTREYLPFHVSFKDNQGIFEEGMEVIQKLWAAEGPHLAPRQALPVRRRAHHAEADPESDAGLHRLVLEALDRARRTARLRPDRRAVRRRHELWRPEAGRRSLQRDLHQARQEARPPDVQLLRAFLRQQGAGGRRPRPPDPLLQGMRDPGAARRSRRPRRRATPTSSTWWSACTRCSRSSSPRTRCCSAIRSSITDTLKKVEAAGFSEVILYFNVGMKPHQMVKEEMDRFMREVAPHFQGKHLERRAA